MSLRRGSAFDGATRQFQGLGETEDVMAHGIIRGSDSRDELAGDEIGSFSGGSRGDETDRNGSFLSVPNGPQGISR